MNQNVVMESAAFITPSKEFRQLILKRPKVPKGFQGKVFKDSEGGGHEVCDPLTDILLIGWW